MVIRSKKDIESLIDKWGFLPFFVNDIEGFSIEDHIDPKCWFTAIPGPWEWKGEITRDGYAYGKIFGRKCGFATLEWYRHLANWRRNGYDFESRKDAGLVPYQDQYLYNALADYGFIQSNGLKSAAGFDKNGGRKGFDTIITHLHKILPNASDSQIARFIGTN